MKLHLPSGLRKALLACLAAVALPAASIPSTIASASGIAAVFLAASQRAEAEFTGPEGVEWEGSAQEAKDISDTVGENGYDVGTVSYYYSEGQGEAFNRLRFNGGSTESSNLKLEMRYGWITLSGDFSKVKNLWLTANPGGIIKIAKDGDAESEKLTGLNLVQDIYANLVQIQFAEEQTDLIANLHIGTASSSQGGTTDVAVLWVAADVTTTGKLDVVEDTTISVSSEKALTVGGLVGSAEGTSLGFGATHAGTLKLNGSTGENVSGKLTIAGDLTMSGEVTLSSSAQLIVSGTLKSDSLTKLTLSSNSKLEAGVSGELTITNQLTIEGAATLKLADGAKLAFTSLTGNGSLTIDLTGITSSLEGYQLFSSTDGWYDTWKSKISLTATVGQWELQSDGTLKSTLSELTWSGNQANWGDSNAFNSQWVDGSSVVFGEVTTKTVNISSTVKTYDMKVEANGYSFTSSGDSELDVEGTLSLADSTTTTFDVETTVRGDLNGGSSTAANVQLGKDMQVQGTLSGQLKFSKYPSAAENTVWLTLGVDANDNARSPLGDGLTLENLGLGLSVREGGKVTFKTGADAEMFSNLDLKLVSGTVQFDGVAFKLKNLYSDADTNVTIATADSSNNKWLEITNGGELKGTMEISEWGGQVILGGDLEIGGLKRDRVSSSRAGQFKSLTDKKNLIINNDADYTAAGLWLGTSAEDAVNLVKKGRGKQTLSSSSSSDDKNATHLWGNVTVEEGILALAGSGAATIEGDVTVTGAAVTVDGQQNYNVSAGLDVKGATTINGKLDVTGDMALYNGLTLSKGGKVSGKFHVAWDGALTLGDDLEVGNLARGNAEDKAAGQKREILRAESVVDHSVYILFSEEANLNVSDLNTMYEAFAPKGEEKVGGSSTVGEGTGVGYGIAGKAAGSAVTLDLATKAETGYDFKIRGANVTLNGGSSLTIGTSSSKKTLELVDSTLVLGDHTLSAGDLSVGGTTGSTISLNMGSNSTGVLTLTGLKFGSDATLTIKLADYTSGSAHDEFTLFGGESVSTWLTNELIAKLKFVDQAGTSISNVTLSTDGKLTWSETPSEGVYWGGGSGETGELTWGGTSGGNFDSTQSSSSQDKAWTNDGSMDVTFVAGADDSHTVKLGEDINAKDLTVQGGAGEYKFTADTDGTPRKLDVQGKLSTTDGAKLDFSKDVSLTVKGDVSLSSNSTLTLHSDMVFGGTLSGEGKVVNGNTAAAAAAAVALASAEDDTVHTLWDNGSTSSINWSTLKGHFGTDTGVLGDKVGYGVSMSTQDLTVSDAATIDRAFKVEGNTHSLSFNAGLTVASGGSIVIGEEATLKLAEKLERDSGNSATIQFSGNGTLEFDMGGDKHFKSFSTAAETKVKANITGNWAFMEDADIDGTLDVVGGHELIFEGTNNIAHLTATQGASSLSKLSLKYRITTSNVSTTIGREGDDSLSIGELNMEAGSLTLNYTNVTVTGLIDSSQTDAVGTITGKSLTVNNVGDNTSYNGSLTLTGDFAKTAEGKLVIQGGPTGSGSLSFGGKVDISGGVVEFGKTTGGVHMSVGGNLTVNNSGGAFTWVATDKNLSVTGTTTLNGTLTLKGGENTLTGAVTADGTLKVEGGSLKLVGGLAGTLSKLTLGAGAKMEVSAGTGFTIEGSQSWGWGSNAEITLAKGVKITLGENFSFAGDVGSTPLTINLAADYLDGVESGQAFFGGSLAWGQGWEDYFTFKINGARLPPKKA